MILSEAISCAVLLALVFGLMAWTNREKVAAACREMTEAWRDVTRSTP